MPTQIDLGQVRVAADELDYDDLNNKPLIRQSGGIDEIVSCESIQDTELVYKWIIETYDIDEQVQRLTVTNPPFYLLFENADENVNFIRRVSNLNVLHSESYSEIIIANDSINNVDYDANFNVIEDYSDYSFAFTHSFTLNTYRLSDLFVEDGRVAIVKNADDSYIAHNNMEYIMWDQLNHPAFAAVATSGSYNDLSNIPDLSTKQDTLVSGTNLKTINNTSILGSGNIDILNDNVCVAIKDVTTYNELVQAFSENKIILVKRSVSDNYYYACHSVQADTTSNEVTFQTMPHIYNLSSRDTAYICHDYNVTQNDIWTESTRFLSYATDSIFGLIKTNQAEGITLNANGQLEIGRRLGQFPEGGMFYPDTIEPTNVGGSTLMLTDGAKYLSLGPRTFGIMAGVNLTCKSAAAGATQYRLSNTQGNRFTCFACKGGRLAIDQTDATENGTALMTDISFANGDPIRAYFGPTESSNDIIITVDRTVNPSASTTKLRMYGTSTASDVIIVGQGNGASGGKAISLGQACHAGGNQCIAFGNSSLSLANNSVALGHTHIVDKQFCFAAGQGHDFTNASNGTSALGIASEITSDTAFAVGNGVFNSNGNITRSNAFEVKTDGSIVLKSPNGTRYKINVDDSGNLTITAV